MSKLSLDALKNRAEAIASEELMNSITGGNTNKCHPKGQLQDQMDKDIQDALNKPCTGNA